LHLPNLGIKVPNMGIKGQGRKVSEAAARYASASLSDALFTATQRRVLACLFDGQGRSHTVSELIQTTGSGSGAVQRELAGLAGSGLLTIEQVGNQKRYRADPDSPIHDELVAIVRKTFGVAGPLRDALEPFADRIHAAFVYGSVAKGADTATSDIDLMIVSDSLGYADVVGALHPLIERMAREINPTIYSRAELAKRIAGGNAFMTRVLEQPKVWLYGGDDDLRA
jgi:predicted nucleotidyltransferase